MSVSIEQLALDTIRAEGGDERLMRPATRTLAWRAYALANGLRHGAVVGRTVAERTGKPVSAQLREQYRLAQRHGFLPEWYYAFDLFEPRNQARGQAFLFSHHKRQLVKFLRRRLFGSPPLICTDKVAFYNQCVDAGLPAVPVIAVARGRQVEFESGFERVPDSDLFIKPVAARRGYCAERWDLAGDGLYHGRNTAHRSLGRTGKTGILERLAKLSVRRSGFYVTKRSPLRLKLSFPPLDYMLQPRIANHTSLADLCNGALSTVRVVSILDERGRGEVTHGTLRMAVGNNRTVDNFRAGGLVSAIDIKTGRLSAATDLGLGRNTGWFDRHPTTGGQIAGRRIEMWDEIRGLAVRAHRAFADQIYVGWDVAPTPDGPVLLEAQGLANLDTAQRAYRTPLGETRFGELLAFHVARALDRSGAKQPITEGTS
jgi:hypothetical protein